MNIPNITFPNTPHVQGNYCCGPNILENPKNVFSMFFGPQIDRRPLCVYTITHEISSSNFREIFSTFMKRALLKFSPIVRTRSLDLKNSHIKTDHFYYTLSSFLHSDLVTECIDRFRSFLYHELGDGQNLQYFQNDPTSIFGRDFHSISMNIDSTKGNVAAQELCGYTLRTGF